MAEKNKLFAQPATHTNKSAFEIILAYGEKKETSHGALTALTGRFGSVRAMFDASPEELKKAPEVGGTKAILVKLMRDLGATYLKERMIGLDAGTMSGAKAIEDYFTLSLSAERIEKFATIFLDGSNRVMDAVVLHEGTINQTAVYPRASIEAALKRSASGLIFVHNHPSGDPTPSQADIALIATLDRTAATLGLIVFDHMITGRRGHWSKRRSSSLK